MTIRASAIVVDAWANKIFKLSEINTKLYDSIAVDSRTFEPVLKLFDPFTQHLGLKFGNICFAEDLEHFKQQSHWFGIYLPWSNDQSHIYDEILKQMEAFHLADTAESKLAKAHVIYGLCAKKEVVAFEILNLFKDQLDHYIELNHKD